MEERSGRPCVGQDSPLRVGEGGEDGSMTVWYAGVAAFIIGLGALLLLLMSVWSARTHVQAVADMAALAGADISSVAVFEANPETSLPCQHAQLVAQKNTVSLAQCWTERQDTLVIVRSTMSVLGRDLHVEGKARAGPAD